MKLLHIDSSITGEESVSRRLTARIVDRLREATPELAVTYRDLAQQPLPHHRLSHEDDADRVETQAALQDFLSSDIVVIGAPMYNFTIPSQLKAWIDTLLVAGRTFKYTADGPQGLAGGKLVVVASARGGNYSDGPAAQLEHHESYLSGIFRFIGIDNVVFVRAEGLGLGPDVRARSIEQALAQADGLASAPSLAAA